MPDQLKLFAVCLGGSTSKSNIELHDVVFVAGSSLVATYPKLKEKWIGFPEEMPHIDAYIELNYADGFQIKLSKEKRKSTHKLFFINCGGYQKDFFGELHQNGFYVAEDRASAIKKAREELCVEMIQGHLDNHLDVEEFLEFDVDDVLEIDRVDEYHLELIPSEKKIPQEIHVGFTPLKEAAD